MRDIILTGRNEKTYLEGKLHSIRETFGKGYLLHRCVWVGVCRGVGVRGGALGNLDSGK